MSATYHETEARTITRLAGTTDAWFLGRYGMNLYRGCEHGCLYCDGRAERYYVQGDFARDVVVKRNAREVLRRELERRREPGFVLLGGGVCDAYQPAEARYGLARGVLEECLELGVPVHVLTKSALVERDLDLLAAINARSRAILSFSANTVDERLRETFEPGAAPLAERFRLLAAGHARGLGTGVMAMPLLPGLSDTPAAIGELTARARAAGADFVCHGGLTLRPGVQQQVYVERLRTTHADLVPGYERLYAAQRRSGTPDPRYLTRLDARCRAALREHGLPGRVPWRLFHGLVPAYAEVAVLLEHRGHERGESPWGPGAQACRTLQQWARERMGRTRGAGAWRAVEAELAALVAERRTASALGLSDSQASELEEQHALVARGPAA